MRISSGLQRALAVALTVAILAAIYTRVDLRLVALRLKNVDLPYFLLALGMFGPQILLASLRWRFMTRKIHPMGLDEAVGMVLAGKALNALLPSKVGEMSKAYFLTQSSPVNGSQAFFVVLLEKMMDLAGLCFIFLMAALKFNRWSYEVQGGALLATGAILTLALFIFIPIHTRVKEVLEGGSRFGSLRRLLMGMIDARRIFSLSELCAVLVMSVVLWSLHVIQILFFFPSLRQWVPIDAAFTYIPLAIFVGLLPLTIGGMGTRDAALIHLFSPYADASLMAAVGMLSSMRYWVDTLFGVPFFQRFAWRGRAAARVASDGSSDRHQGEEGRV
jgi:hypothetical protein